MSTIKHCLVTGASGFIGRQLVVRLLELGYRVRALCRQPCSNLPSAAEIQLVDLHAPSADWLSLFGGIDTVFHLANTAHTAANAANYSADAKASLLLAQMASKAGVARFVYVSSVKAMAKPGVNTADESWPGWPVESDDPYGYWKRITEQRLLEEITCIPHLSILRPCLVYGNEAKGNLRNLMRAVNHSWCPRLPENHAVRSMVSVRDVVEALLLLASHSGANRKVFIVEDGKSYTVAGIQRVMLLTLGREMPNWELPSWSFRAAGILGDTLRLFWPACPFTSTKLSNLLEPAAYSAARLRGLGWQPSTSFDQELPEMLGTYRREAAV